MSSLLEWMVRNKRGKNKEKYPDKQMNFLCIVIDPPITSCILPFTAFFWLDSAQTEKYTVVVHFSDDNLCGGRNETSDDIPPVCVCDAGL